MDGRVMDPILSKPRKPEKSSFPAWRQRGKSLGEVKTVGIPDAQQTDPATGLNLRMVALMSPYARYALMLAYDYFHMDKTKAPSVFFTAGSSGTIPELVTFGALLDYGFTPGQGATHFIFQKALLGGRFPGGSLADFVVFNGPRAVAVYVDSFFHSVNNPFGAGAKRTRDRILFERVLSRGAISALRFTNEERWNFPMENGGPDRIIHAEIEAVITA